MQCSRRALLGLLGSATAGVPAWSAPEQSLGAIAAAHGFMFGASAGPVIDTDAAYRRLYETQTRIITTDIALKTGAVAPQPGPKRFESADRLLQFCARNKIPLRGHCLIWNEWVPGWIKSMSVAERRTFFDAYVDEVVGRYRGMLHSWDIVNEPFWPGHKAPGGYRLGPWYEAFGPDYIARAFRRAAQADPRVKLVLNEAHTEREDDVGRPIRAGLLRLVDELKQAGVPLHAVGLQGHLQPRHPHDHARYAEFVQALAQRGVEIYITEFDVQDVSFPDDVATRDRMIAETAERFLSNVLRIPAVKMVVTWQLADHYSFYTAEAKHKKAARMPRPLPFDETMQPKPLWYALARAFQTARKG